MLEPEALQPERHRVILGGFRGRNGAFIHKRSNSIVFGPQGPTGAVHQFAAASTESVVRTPWPRVCRESRPKFSREFAESLQRVCRKFAERLPECRPRECLETEEHSRAHALATIARIVRTILYKLCTGAEILATALHDLMWPNSVIMCK